MKIDIHINGRLSLELTPETDIERLVLEQMQKAAAKGQAVKIGQAGVDACLVSVER